MTVKNSSPLKQYRAVITIPFAAPDRETAQKRAREEYGDSPDIKIKIQEQTVAWLTLPDPPAQSS